MKILLPFRRFIAKCKYTFSKFIVALTEVYKQTQFKKIKEGFLTAKIEEQIPAYMLANTLFIFGIFTIFCIISGIVCNFFRTVGIYMLVFSIILLFIFMFWERAFSLTIPFSVRLVDYSFGRYGRVVCKNDWKRMKKEYDGAYRFIWDKKNIGHCYIVAWTLALWVDDAKVMYCSIGGEEDGKTAHAVVVKENCVYDTNLRRHYDFDEYIKMKKAEVYQIFEKEVFAKESFFDDVREDFKKWCAERNVYCDPQ